MAAINKTDIQLKAPQRLDDTDQGGGQMTSTVILSGAVNNLFPDISRLDRVYGRVSLRKGYVAVNTDSRVTYYGSHAILTQQTEDPNVSVVFFSSKNWFDTRIDARDRMEAYLVKGPQYQAALWGNHYTGTKNLSFFMHMDNVPPVIGDVLVLAQNEGLSTEKKQYVRITDVSTESRAFVTLNSVAYTKKIATVTIGDSLQFDFTGEEVDYVTSFTAASVDTKIYTTVAADASRYYGISALAENATASEFQIKAKSILASIVPSAQSETAITDAGVGTSVSPLIQTDPALTKVTRSISYSITGNSKLYIGEGVLPGSFSWTGGLTLTDDGTGNILSGTTNVGSIDYVSGIITFGTPGVNAGGTGSATYTPAAAPSDISETGGIVVKTNNRGFTYVYNCTPVPKKGTLKIEYLSGGKWYTLKDTGQGQLKGSDPAIGSGAVNFITGSVSMTFGALPDADSYILLFWGKDAQYFDLKGETLPLRYEFNTTHTGITKNSFKIRWNTNGFCIMDNGNGKLFTATGTEPTWVISAVEVGSIEYATGLVKFGIGAAQTVPVSSANFRISYSYGDKFTESFNPIRQMDGTVKFNLTNLTVRPGTFRVVWHTFLLEYYSQSAITMISAARIDPEHIFVDDGSGLFRGDVDDGTGNWIQGHIDYTTGEVHFMPDRKGTFPMPVYEWSDFRMQNMTTPNSPADRMFAFDHLIYLPAASLWPTDGIIVCEYSSVDGALSADYTRTLQKQFFVQPNSGLAIVPGSLSLMSGSTYIIDPGGGRLFKNISGTTGSGTEVGTINYNDRIFTITDDTLIDRTITVRNCIGSAQIDPVQLMIFRCPAAPVRNASVGIKANLGDGTLITGTSDFDGNITGDEITGTIDYNTGICHIVFGKWVTDNASVNTLPWYAGAPKKAGFVWRPASVSARTVLLNCVVTSYLPLDSDLLGLNPVRLPIDGKVPIFRDGYILLVHNTQNETLPTISTSGPLSPLSRTNVNLIELYDSRADVDGGSQYWPDAGNYSVNLTTGVITILPTYNLTGFVQPMKALHRIEDMVLASDVQITGHISLTRALTHSYPKDTSFVSSVLPLGDLQSRAYNEMEQTTWSGVWSDDLIGSQPLASFNFVDYPITVINRTATKERWLLLFTTSGAISIVGENLGVLAIGIPITTGNYSPIDGKWLGDAGFTGGYIAVRNRNFGDMPYWVLNCAGFGAGWSANNGIRFNTDAANHPLWFIRTTLQAPPTEPTDKYIMQIRGDSA